MANQNFKRNAQIVAACDAALSIVDISGAGILVLQADGVLDGWTYHQGLYLKSFKSQISYLVYIFVAAALVEFLHFLSATRLLASVKTVTEANLEESLSSAKAWRIITVILFIVSFVGDIYGTLWALSGMSVGIRSIFILIVNDYIKDMELAKLTHLPLLAGPSTV